MNLMEEASLEVVVEAEVVGGVAEEATRHI
jgi:hypothetical protein